MRNTQTKNESETNGDRARAIDDGGGSLNEKTQEGGRTRVRWMERERGGI